jgi:membrane protease YdiL (CAAX protease family)
MFALNKKIKYIISAFVAITLNLVIANGMTQQAFPERLSQSFDFEKFVRNQNFFRLEILLFLCLLLVFIGFIQLVGFTLRNFKKPLLATDREKIFPLPTQETLKIVFYIAFFAFFIYFAQWALVFFRIKINLIAAIVFLNLLLEVGAITIILIKFPSHYFNFDFKKNNLLFAAKAYATALPIIIGFLFLNGFLLDKLGVMPSYNPAIELVLKVKNVPLLVILTLQIIFFGPLAEELFFRGLIYRLFSKKWGFLFSAFLSSLLFALLHRSRQDGLPIFALGLLLCFVYEKTAKISVPVIFHIINNCLNLSFLLVLKNFL